VSVPPALGSGTKGLLVFWPIMQRSWVEIRTRRPNHRVNFRIKPHLSEYSRVTKRAKNLPCENSFQIDRPRQAIIEAQTKRIGPDMLDRSDSINRMTHSLNDLPLNSTETLGTCSITSVQGLQYFFNLVALLFAILYGALVSGVNELPATQEPPRPPKRVTPRFGCRRRLVIDHRRLR